MALVGCQIMPENPVLSSIKIDPDDEIITMDFGETISFAVTGLDQLGNPYSNFEASWHVSNDLGEFNQNQGNEVKFTAVAEHEDQYVEGEIKLEAGRYEGTINIVIGEKPADHDE